METVLAIVVGALFAVAVYLMLRRSIVKLIIGLGFLGHAANLLIFTAGGLRRSAPLIPADGALAPQAVADPVPQALILTAIVIGFAVSAFAIVLVKRTAAVAGTDDVDALQLSESSPEPGGTGGPA
jgi:multicomponent Na+:H+ antiporter subunit C